MKITKKQSAVKPKVPKGYRPLRAGTKIQRFDVCWTRTLNEWIVSAMVGCPTRRGRYARIKRIPPGWRVLRPGDVVQEGDRYWRLREGNWAETSRPGMSIFEHDGCPYIRRKIK